MLFNIVSLSLKKTIFFQIDRLSIRMSVKISETIIARSIVIEKWFKSDHPLKI